MQEKRLAATVPPQHPIRRALRTRWQVPIVNRHRQIVGWTSENPQVTAGRYMRHTYAEQLVRDPIICAYVEIADQAAAVRAGAPAGWQDPWRCLALVSEKATQAGEEEAAPLLVVTN